MKLRSEQLTAQLAQQAMPLLTLSGDDPLLLQEAADAFRAAARRAGAIERVTHTIDQKGFAWDALAADSQSLSLFAESRLLELHFSIKPDATAGAALAALAARPPVDTFVLITLPKLDGAAGKSAWAQALEAAGGWVTFYPIDPSAWPAWLRQRAHSRGVTLEDAALTLLAERSEGNLLAAAQAIDKLATLTVAGERTTVAAVDGLLSESARYSPFDLADAVLQGDAERAARLLLALWAEGTAELQVLWPLQKDLRALTLLAEAQALNRASGATGITPAQLTRVGFWSQRQGAARAALQRLPIRQLHALQQVALQVDEAVKGQNSEHPRDVLLRLVMAMAGRPLFALT